VTSQLPPRRRQIGLSKVSASAARTTANLDNRSSTFEIINDYDTMSMRHEQQQACALITPSRCDQMQRNRRAEKRRQHTDDSSSGGESYESPKPPAAATARPVNARAVMLNTSNPPIVSHLR